MFCRAASKATLRNLGGLEADSSRPFGQTRQVATGDFCTAPVRIADIQEKQMNRFFVIAFALAAAGSFAVQARDKTKPDLNHKPRAAQGAEIARSSAAGRSHISKIEITERVRPAFGGRSFGSVGQYELILGRAHGLADPLSPRNSGVVDLRLAPRNAQGLVEYSFDVAFLKPVDSVKGNGAAILEVTNRGRPILQTSLLRGNGDVRSEAGAGESSILEQGYTLVWTGWQADIAPGPGVLTASFPIASEPRGPVTAIVRDEIALDGSAGAQIAPVAADARAFEVTLYYPLADPSGPPPRVRVRQRADDAPTLLGGDRFEILGRDKLRIQRQPGFDLGALYEVEYTARDPKVMGLSFVSIRDLVSLLRQGAGAIAPLQMPRIERAIATGLSQSGRYLRDFIYQDFNLDESGRQVFEGVLPQGSGAKRGFFNQRFAQPGRAPDFQHEMRGYPGANFPFAYANQTDPVSGRAEGILTRCNASRSCPKIIHMDSDWEQWQQAGSLIVSDALGRPSPLPENVRAYLVTSTPHASLPPNAGVRPLTQPPARAICEQILNPLTWAPVLRASVANLNLWIRDGTLPPATRYPSGPAEGRVSIDALRNMNPVIPGYPFSMLYGKLQVVDFQQNPPRPVSAYAPYAVQLLRVNSDGNGVDGVVLPEVAVAVATYSGRNTRAAGYAQGELCHTLGSYIPFPRTEAERLATGDPRRSIAERYRDNADYQARLMQVAQQLVAEQLMLPADAESYRSYTLP